MQKKGINTKQGEIVLIDQTILEGKIKFIKHNRLKRDLREVAVISRLGESFVHIFAKFLWVRREELKIMNSYILCSEVILQGKHQNLSQLFTFITGLLRNYVPFIKNKCRERK